MVSHLSLALALLAMADVGSVNGFLATSKSPRPSSAAVVVQQRSSPLHQARSEVNESSEVSRRQILTSVIAGAAVASSVLMYASPVQARLEGINKPDLLPAEKGLNVIQTEKFLTPGQAKRLDQLLANLERDTGFRVRVLCQAYPNTPGLAIRDYWDLGKEGQKDDKYIVLVVDQFGGKGNALNFNVGEGVKFALPNGKFFNVVVNGAMGPPMDKGTNVRQSVSLILSFFLTN